ncbi:dephospho-CoA kinase [Mediterraneibacter agrestimuris]|uniref:dephospho-CoA kinase n=1 Tax=Mediterraneibacter agrestimuris TaxID=2941333 RepID=UPI00203DE341|nr:dephospho-CoA kinase [Mediterraneibacter agrestimuris]
MKVLGITGGVGSGKSCVLEYLKTEYGAVICQLDEVAKALQKKGQSCYSRIVEAFGQVILTDDGELDRGKLSQIVFRDASRLKLLNTIVHPAVKQQVQRYISEEKAKRTSLYVIEAALLPTAGYEDICDEMWYIFAAEDVRRERLRAFRGYTDEKITDMIQSQPAEEIFRLACTAVIDNSGGFEETKKQIGELLI